MTDEHNQQFEDEAHDSVYGVLCPDDSTETEESQENK